MTFFGKIEQISDTFFHGDAEMVVIHRPNLFTGQQWDLLSLFNGAFDGWGQALRFLSKSSSDFLLGHQVCVDFDDIVVQAWSIKHRTNVLKAPFRPQGKWIASMLTGPTWSKGGKGTGLGSEPGWDFVEGVLTAFIAQPVLILFECVDELLNHPHFCIM